MARNTSVTLGEHFDHFVSEKIQEGRFQSVSEVVRAGLRTLEQDEIKLSLLKEKLKAGENSPLVKNFSGVETLRRDIQAGMDELDRGEGSLLKMDEIKAKARKIKNLEWN